MKPGTTGVSVVLMTAPDEAKAAEIARALLDERMIACANILPRVRSLYRWQGKVHDDAEVLVLMKAPASEFKALEARVKSLHPYQTPELLQFEVSDGLPEYVKWVLSAGS